MLKTFEEVLLQYEPMISAALRQLNVYRHHDQFRQAGRVALWQAWTRYDEEKGHFAPYASRSIRGALLDLIKNESRFEENVMQTEDDLLVDLIEKERDLPTLEDWSDTLTAAFDQLAASERQLIQWIFVEGLTQAECAAQAGISVPGIKKRRERMLVKLKGLLV